MKSTVTIRKPKTYPTQTHIINLFSSDNYTSQKRILSNCTIVSAADECNNVQSGGHVAKVEECLEESGRKKCIKRRLRNRLQDASCFL